MGQKLRPLATFSEDQCSIPRTTWQLKMSVTSVPGHLTSSYWQTCRKITTADKIKINYFLKWISQKTWNPFKWRNKKKYVAMFMFLKCLAVENLYTSLLTRKNKTKPTKHSLKPVQIANIVIPLDGQQGETMKHLQQILFIVEYYSHTHFTAAMAIHKWHKGQWAPAFSYFLPRNPKISMKL